MQIVFAAVLAAFVVASFVIVNISDVASVTDGEGAACVETLISAWMMVIRLALLFRIVFYPFNPYISKGVMLPSRFSRLRRKRRGAGAPDNAYFNFLYKCSAPIVLGGGSLRG